MMYVECITSIVQFVWSKSSLSDYSEAYLVFKGNISIEAVQPPAANPNNNSEDLIFKNCAPFTDCMSEINNTQTDNTKDIDTVMPMYNIIEYSDNSSKQSGSLWHSMALGWGSFSEKTLVLSW